MSRNWVGWADPAINELSDCFGERPLADLWPTPRLVRVKAQHERVEPVGDTPTHQSPGVKVFSARAVAALRDLIEPAAEILPVVSELGEFYAINVLARLDALIESESVISRFDSGAVLSIRRYVFDPARLVGPSLFRLPQRTVSVYFDERFMERMNQAELDQVRTSMLWSEETGALVACPIERLVMKHKQRNQREGEGQLPHQEDLP